MGGLLKIISSLYLEMTGYETNYELDEFIEQQINNALSNWQKMYKKCCDDVKGIYVETSFLLLLVIVQSTIWCIVELAYYFLFVMSSSTVCFLYCLA